MARQSDTPTLTKRMSDYLLASMEKEQQKAFEAVFENPATALLSNIDSSQSISPIKEQSPRMNKRGKKPDQLGKTSQMIHRVHGINKPKILLSVTTNTLN